MLSAALASLLAACAAPTAPAPAADPPQTTADAGVAEAVAEAVASPAQPASEAAPPAAHPLQRAAEALLRKDTPEFDRYYADYAIGDLDRDGRDDIAVEYGIGEEGAMRHVANHVRMLMAREGGLQLLADDGENLFGYCAALRDIVDGVLRVDALEACMVPFPKTIAHHRYEWSGQGLRPLGEESPEQRILSQLAEIETALRERRDEVLVRHLREHPVSSRPGAAPTPAEQGVDRSLFVDAPRRDAFAKAVERLRKAGLQSLGSDEWRATVRGRDANSSGEYRLQIDLSPDQGLVETDDASYVVDADVMLEWPQRDGSHYHANFRLIEGELYLLDHNSDEV
ncbi:hypothetical protein GLA29479_1168 [Lysobacter antibioticus]|uniref:hypothetical protein n=1 Tax=Lysobacter antibioticus TaxID=84531 RepID=UPI0007170BBE|nr:hypothetical protein [Lysobacter antibioticus]ALN62052.1 hypothetical protein GLA29479_1168 [Lysobacter antibioticus]